MTSKTKRKAAKKSAPSPKFLVMKAHCCIDDPYPIIDYAVVPIDDDLKRDLRRRRAFWKASFLDEPESVYALEYWHFGLDWLADKGGLDGPLDGAEYLILPLAKMPKAGRETQESITTECDTMLICSSTDGSIDYVHWDCLVNNTSIRFETAQVPIQEILDA